MIRNLKALGLALVAVFALSAVVASAASAQQGKLTSDGPVTLTADETGVGQNWFEAFGLKVECPGTTITGHAYNVTPHGLIPNGATTATLTPHFNDHPDGCHVTPGPFVATVDDVGCDFVAHIGSTTGGVAGTYGVTFDLVCNEVGKEITVTIWTTAADLTAKKTPMCILHIKQQNGLVGAHATNGSGGHINIAGLITGIHVTKTGTGTHAILCPGAVQTTSTAKFNIDTTVTGKNAEGGATGISLSE